MWIFSRDDGRKGCSLFMSDCGSLVRNCGESFHRPVEKSSIISMEKGYEAF